MERASVPWAVVRFWSVPWVRLPTVRRLISLAASSAFVVLLAAVPASAAVGDDTMARKPAGEQTSGGWIPVPSLPFDLAAGVRCDFPVHGEPIVDKVQKMVLQTYPDGSPKQEIYAGALIFRVTNTLTRDDL